MTKYLNIKNKVLVYGEDDVSMTDELEVKFYNVAENENDGFHLKVNNDDISNPDKIYGQSNIKYCEKILSTYKLEGKNMGVLLAGYKGCGKTLLARTIAIEGIKQKLPVIFLKDSFEGNNFKLLMDSISCKCIVIIDEYDKLYTGKKEHELLSILDGISNSNKLFVLTSNEIGKISPYLKNRPGRIRYMITYTGLLDNEIEEIVQDLIKDKDRVGEVSEFLCCLPKMTFDKVKSFVQELNYYGETCKEAFSIMNIDSQDSEFKEFEFKVLWGKKDVTEFYDASGKRREKLNPMNSQDMYFYTAYDKEEDQYKEIVEECPDFPFMDPIRLSWNDINSELSSIKNQHYVYNVGGFTISLKPFKSQKMTYEKFIL